MNGQTFDGETSYSYEETEPSKAKELPPEVASSKQIPLWVQEFGLSYDVPPEVQRHPGIVDQSWHNDAAPSFTLAKWTRKNDLPQVCLWVEHPDASQRAFPDSHRFCVTLDRRGIHDIYEGNDVAAALAALEKGQP